MRYQFHGVGSGDQLRNNDSLTISKYGQIRFFREEESLLISNKETDDLSPRYETLLDGFQVYESVALAVFISLLSGKRLCYIKEIGDNFYFRVGHDVPDCITPIHFQFLLVDAPIRLQPTDHFCIDPTTSEILFTRHAIRLHVYDLHQRCKDPIRRLRNHPLERPQLESIMGLFSLLSGFSVHPTPRAQGKFIYTFSDQAVAPS